jgi:hypothetical protein
MKAKRRKEPDHRNYNPIKPGEPTSYDTNQPETNTPQEVREGEEPTAQQAKKQKQEAGGAESNPPPTFQPG